MISDWNQLPQPTVLCALLKHSGTAFNKLKIMSEVAHENELKKVKTIYRFHKLVFHGDKSSPECFNRAHKTVGCGSWFQSDIIQGKRKILHNLQLVEGGQYLVEVEEGICLKT
jgi:hypothetical protein